MADTEDYNKADEEEEDPYDEDDDFHGLEIDKKIIQEKEEIENDKESKETNKKESKRKEKEPVKATNFDVSLFEVWLRKKKDLSEGYIYVTLAGLKTFLVSNPDLEKLDSYNEFLINHAVKKRSTYFRSILKLYIEFKIQNDELREHLISGLIKPKVRQNYKRERKNLSDEQILNVINYIKEPKHKVIALIQTMTGVRAGDIMRLRRKDGIFLEKYNDQNVLRLNIIGKGGKRNIVYIHDEVVIKIIFDYINTNIIDDEYYFLKKFCDLRKMQFNSFMSEKVNYLYYVDDLKFALQMANINKESFASHDFRRCFARKVWEKYKDVYILQNLLAHTDPKTTLLYLQQSGLKNIDYHYAMQMGKK